MSSIKPLPIDLRAVSYTHLDVYKRQTINWSIVPTRSMPHMARESFIAILNQRTSSSQSGGTPRFWILGWQR